MLHQPPFRSLLSCLHFKSTQWLLSRLLRTGSIMSVWDFRPRNSSAVMQVPVQSCWYDFGAEWFRCPFCVMMRRLDVKNRKPETSAPASFRSLLRFDAAISNKWTSLLTPSLRPPSCTLRKLHLSRKSNGHGNRCTLSRLIIIDWTHNFDTSWFKSLHLGHCFLSVSSFLRI